MCRRFATAALIPWLAAFAVSPARAVNVPPGAKLSDLDRWLSVEDTIQFNVSTTLTVDRTEDRIRTIAVDDWVHATIDFKDTAYQIRFRPGDNFITLGFGATLTIAGDDPGSGFDLAWQNPDGNGTLTVNGPVNGAEPANTIRIGNNTLVCDSADLYEVIAQVGRIEANGNTSITVLSVDPGPGQGFTYAGSGDSTVNAITPAAGTFVKRGTGTLTVTDGFNFGAGMAIHLAIDGGTFVDASGTEISFDDDLEKIAVGEGATYVTAGNITGHPGTSTNFEAAAGSTVNFNSAGVLTLTAKADNDFELLGTVNIQDGCTVQMAGAYCSLFGSVNIANTAGWIGEVPNSSLLFVPGSTVLLQGSGRLTVDGRATDTRITVGTTTHQGSFTIDRGSSQNMAFRNVALSNCRYASKSGGPAVTELPLDGVSDNGHNTNWFVVPPFAAEAGPNKSIFTGRKTTLEGSEVGGSGSYVFAWSPETALSAANVATPIASPARTTVYTLTVTDRADMSNSKTDTMTVIVNACVTATAGPDKTIVAGRSIALAGSTSGGSGLFAYSWSPPDGLSATNVANPTASPNVMTTYTLVVTDLGDESRVSTDKVTITVNPPVTAKAGPDASVDSDAAVTLIGSATGGSGQYAYSWTPTDGLDNPNTATPTCTLTGNENEYGSRSVEYTLTVTDLGDGNRIATDTVTVTVASQPPDTGLCGGGFGCSLFPVNQPGYQADAGRALPMLPVTLLGLCWLKHAHGGRRR